MKSSIICLWFDGNAEAAVTFYSQIFKDAKIHNKFYSEIAAPRQGRDTPLTIMFEIGGIQYMALNGGPQYNFSPAISIMINCDTQEEIDYYWEALSKGGQTMACGWLTDKFGISWQITPSDFGKWIQSKEPGKAERVMKAMMQMVKLDLLTLQNA